MRDIDDDGVRINISWKIGSTKTRRLCQLGDTGEEPSISVHNNSLSNCYRALVERLVYHEGKRPIKPLKQFDLRASKDIRKYETIVPKITSDEFIDKYVGHKRKMYTKAKNSLNLYPFCYTDSKIKFFTKPEKFNYKAKPNQVPRGIQPRNPRYNLTLGRYISAMEKVIFREIDSLFGHCVVMKGKNAEERGKALRQHWEQFSDPVAVMVDAKRFDQHIRKRALKYEHRVYMRHAAKKDRRRLKQILDMQLVTQGVCYTEEGNIKYKLPGVRCSGDINTSMGNVIIMTHLMYDYLTSLNINFRLVNDGDDSVIILDQSDLHHLDDMYNWFVQYGFKMEIEKTVYEFEHIKFCQCNPVWDGSGWLMVRDPRVVVSRDCYTIKSVRTKGQFDYYRGAIGNCGIAAYGGMPVIGEFYNWMSRGAKNVRSEDTSLGMYWMSLGMDRKLTTISQETRYSFFKAFDITPDVQLSFEKDLASKTMLYRPSRVHQY